MQQVGLNEVIARVAKHLGDNELEPVPALLFPALNQFPDNPALWFYAGFFHNRVGAPAQAEAAWRRSYELEPQPLVLANLGAVLKDIGQPDQARVVLRRCLNAIPDDAGAACNITGTFVNEGCPHEGIEIGEAAVAGGYASRQTQFNLALLHLEAGNFARGFELYANGEHEARDRRIYGSATRMDASNFEAAKGSRLVVYGEQGIGDELMFATMLPDIRKDFTVTFDCHPRLDTLHATAPWGDLERHATRKEKPTWFTEGDYYAPIGDLAQFYRKDRAAFAWRGPYYQGDPSKVRPYLDALADGRKVVGLAMRGGSLKTARTYRVIRPDFLVPLLERTDTLFVSLDYEDMSDVVAWVQARYGPDRFLWHPSINWAWEYHHVANLIAGLDGVISVCQSVAHLAAAMGRRTAVLTPSRPAWRYGVERRIQPCPPEQWYWYPSGDAALCRQLGADWGPAVRQSIGWIYGGDA